MVKQFQDHTDEENENFLLDKEEDDESDFDFGDDFDDDEYDDDEYEA